MSPLPLDIATFNSILGWWVANFFIGLGFYLVFAAERKCPTFGFGFTSLGVLLWTLFRAPEWVPPSISRDILVTATLLVLFLLGIKAAQWIWRINELAPPQKRARELVIGPWKTDSQIERRRDWLAWITAVITVGILAAIFFLVILMPTRMLAFVVDPRVATVVWLTFLVFVAGAILALHRLQRAG